MMDNLYDLFPYIVVAAALAFALRNTKGFWQLRSQLRPTAERTVAGSPDAVDLYWRPG